MTRHRIRFSIVALLVALALIAGITPFALAQDDAEVEIKGTVLSIDEAAGSFSVQGEDGQVHIIFPGDGFDWTTLAVGAIVEVEGTQNADGSVDANKVEVDDAGDDADDPGDDDSSKATSFYCMQADVMHPFGARLAEQYEVDYETVQGWFCDGFGWGQVKHALETSKLTDGDPEALLQQRADGFGWGQIWQELLLIGRFRGSVDGHDATATQAAGIPTLNQGRSAASNGKSSTLGVAGRSNAANGNRATLNAAGGSAKTKTTGRPASPGKSGQSNAGGKSNKGR